MANKFVVKHRRLDRKEDTHVVMTLRLEKELQEKYDQLAMRSDRSRNELIGMALYFAIDRLEFIDAEPDDENTPN